MIYMQLQQPSVHIGLQLIITRSALTSVTWFSTRFISSFMLVRSVFSNKIKVLAFEFIAKPSRPSPIFSKSSPGAHEDSIQKKEEAY